jgi:hypothetical protein
MKIDNDILNYHSEVIIKKYPKTQLWQIIKISEANKGTLSLGYWLIGQLQADKYKIGGCINVFRLANNEHPEGKIGHFISSEILTLETHEDYDIVHTNNSIYKIRKINL